MKKTLSRREFCQCACTSALALAVGPAATKASLLVKSGASSPVVNLDVSAVEYAALATVGGSVKIPDPNNSSPAIICRTGAATVTALSSACTHMGCEVPLPQDGKIICDCHGSQFDTNGAVLNGPASRPLKKYNASVAGNLITVNFGGSPVAMRSGPKRPEHLHVTRKGDAVCADFDHSAAGAVRMQVIDIRGRQVFSRTFRSSPAIWNTHGEARGVYRITISGTDQAIQSCTVELP